MEQKMQCPQIQKDMNGDGVQTISDLWAILSVVFYWPGNKLIEIVAQAPKSAEFFEISPQSCGGWVSLAVSAIVWLVGLSTVGGVIGWLDRH
jgi:hypothetical protein